MRVRPLIIGSRWLAGTSIVGAVPGRPAGAAVTRCRGGISRLFEEPMNGILIICVVVKSAELQLPFPPSNCSTSCSKSVLTRLALRRRPAGPPPTAAVAGRWRTLPAVGNAGEAPLETGRIRCCSPCR